MFDYLSTFDRVTAAVALASAIMVFSECAGLLSLLQSGKKADDTQVKHISRRVSLFAVGYAAGMLLFISGRLVTWATS